jgi:hypothetical protein
MNDFIPIAVFLGCVIATLGLVRVCEWLRPASRTQHHESSGPRGALPRQEERR